MVVAGSNMQMHSTHSYKSGAQVSTSTKMTAAGFFGIGSTPTSGQVFSRTSSRSMQFQNAMISAGDSRKDALPSESYTSKALTSGTQRAVRTQDTHTSIRSMLLQYIEMIREMMLQKISGHRSSTISWVSGQDSIATGVLDLTSGSQEYTTWYREDTTTFLYEESESTSFHANGTVVTADGREISIRVGLNMSRSYTETLSTYSGSVEHILTDPLVIQLDDCPISISDETFEFDMDQDGVKEHISKLSFGSAFLAYDKNQDGIINDGSELFGTKSGNGFRDLAAYDKDGNDWIDENDSIYKDLRLWQKDGQGNDKLLTLKDAGIGALYLGYQPTRFSLNSTADNSTNGVIRSSGIALSENGTARTISQIDFAVH